MKLNGVVLEVKEMAAGCLYCCIVVLVVLAGG